MALGKWEKDLTTKNMWVYSFTETPEHFVSATIKKDKESGIIWSVISKYDDLNIMFNGASEDLSWAKRSALKALKFVMKTPKWMKAFSKRSED